ncbi:hypothetical protein TNCV_4817491 [Trichonephila clavipes]|nr:hypothetical protein TNCV_4817491 [Trichonephila clavipes]
MTMENSTEMELVNASIGNSDVLGFAILALESEAWLRERRTNSSAGGVGYGVPKLEKIRTVSFLGKEFTGRVFLFIYSLIFDFGRGLAGDFSANNVSEGNSLFCPFTGKVFSRYRVGKGCAFFRLGEFGAFCITRRVTEVLAVNTKRVLLSLFDMTISSCVVFAAFKASWSHITIRGCVIEVIAVEALGYSSNEVTLNFHLQITQFFNIENLISWENY